MFAPTDGKKIQRWKEGYLDICTNGWKKYTNGNKLQKLEDALIEQMLTATDLVKRVARGDQGDHGDWGDRRNGQIC